jgi:hypothetical protein
MASPDDQISVPRRELDAIAADIAAVEALLDALKALAVRSQEILSHLRQRGTLQ